MADEEDDGAPIGKEEALRLKTLSEETYTSNNLDLAFKFAKRAHKLHPSLDGLSELLAAFKILRAAATPISKAALDSNTAPPLLDYYTILDVERFSHINLIRKQYKKLALTLHPDKTPFVACEDAFKLVGEATRVLSDKVRRKEYDVKLRIAMQSDAEAVPVAAEGEEIFQTACSKCKSLHQFARNYLGNNLICPSCKSSFEAVEIEGNHENEEDGIEAVPSRVSARIQKKIENGEKVGLFEKFGIGVKRKTSTISEILERSSVKIAKTANARPNSGLVIGLRARSVETVADKDNVGYGDSNNKINEMRKDEYSGRAKRVKVREEETLTLSQIQRLAKKKVQDGKSANVVDLEIERPKTSKRGNEEVVLIEEEKENDNEVLKIYRRRARKDNEASNKASDAHVSLDSETTHVESDDEREKDKDNETVITTGKRERRINSKYNSLEVITDRKPENRKASEKIERLKSLKKRNLEIMSVQDADFHDFDKDRRVRSFKKGQVWAVYDDDDGMPRQYALIDEVTSVKPFEVNLSWLKFKNNGNEKLSCGKFKVSGNDPIKYLNLFSHVVDCERAAREIYRIFPRKGSVWALHKENVSDKRCYEVVVCLSSYSDVYGLSVGYLEKVEGFTTVFKRKEIGPNAVMLLVEDDMKRLSHRIPSKKLSGEEAPDLPNACWELDPASLTPQ